MANTQYSGGRPSESGTRQKRARREGAPRPSRKNDASRTGELNRTGANQPQRAYTSDGNGSGYRSNTPRRGHKRHQPAHAARHAKPQKKRFPVWGMLIILLLVGALGAGGVYLVMNILHPYEGARVEDGQQVTVVIPEGSSGTAIIQELLDAGVIHSSKDFRKAVQQQNADQSLRCGTYTFVTGSDPSDVVAQLVKGPNSSEGQLQVPEGLTLKKTAKLVEESLGIPAKEFIKQAKAANYVDDYPFLELAAKSKGTLEGYLYPKTYDLSGKEVTADTVIRLMLSQYQSEVADLDFTEAKSHIASQYNLKVNDYDILKIASIIEKEAINEDDRPKVSSVFYNRLSIGKALESDATMGYVTGGAVDADDLKTDSPYNTYLYQGLPPTPICSPSQWAIEAAVEPADTNYYYFFIIEEGDYSNHTFSETYEEHDEAYAAALAEMAGDTKTKED
ncbi:MAG: endolytic transglycosylase MltG [Coriobacteriales bacterium]|nr:endolytic transglycosylase MltG [Coriobacteriales bacterium]